MLILIINMALAIMRRTITNDGFRNEDNKGGCVLLTTLLLCRTQIIAAIRESEDAWNKIQLFINTYIMGSKERVVSQKNILDYRLLVTQWCI